MWRMLLRRAARWVGKHEMSKNLVVAIRSPGLEACDVECSGDVSGAREEFQASVEAAKGEV